MPSLAPAHPIALPDESFAWSVSAAISPNGARHYVFDQCDSDACKIAYYRAHGGNPFLRLEITPSPPFYGFYRYYLYPDIAVTDDDQVFVVWYVGGASNHTIINGILYASIVTDTVSIDSVTNLAMVSRQPPKVIARGTYVYAVYAMYDGVEGLQWRYRQLQPLDAEGNIGGSDTVYASRPQLGIDSQGDLHAVYRLTDGSKQTIAYWKTGTISETILAITENNEQHLILPDMVLDPDDTAHVVVGITTTTGISLAILSLALSPTAPITTEIPLTNTLQPWSLYGQPHLVNGIPYTSYVTETMGVPAMTGITSTLVVFSAKNSELSEPEIWVYSPRHTSLMRITNNAWADGEPLITSVDHAPVIGWRTIDGSGCQRDVYTWDTIHGIRQIHTSASTDACHRGYALVGQGKWGSGIWIDSLSDDDDTAVPWVVFNAYRTYLPIIQR
ncbi:MAG TPA: hypothetical protein PKH77_03625 [Anaerolineae bacterium]|nr:hypothetical protein [Anaerolineae bacterium]